jgi:hypothetical protein
MMIAGFCKDDELKETSKPSELAVTLANTGTDRILVFHDTFFLSNPM